MNNKVHSYPSSIFQIDWSKGGVALHNFIRGLDSSPGATTFIKPQTKEGIVEDGDATIEVKFFGSSLWVDEYETKGDALVINGLNKPAVVHEAGLLITANDGVKVKHKIYLLLRHRKSSLCNRKRI